MSFASVTPRVRLMTLCDRIRESAIEPGVFNLRGVRQRIHGDFFPFSPARLWLFLLLSSPRTGIYPGHIAVILDRTDKAIFYGNLDPIPMFAEPGTLPVRAHMQCTFPEPDRYTFQLWFFQEKESDILKAELPFDVEG